MKRNLIKSIVALTLATACICPLSGCTRVAAAAESLTASVTASTSVTATDIDEKFTFAYTDFSSELLRRSFSGENTVVSPLSAMLALGIAANGACGETAEDYTHFFGGISPDEMNKYLYSYIAELDGDASKLTSASSLWLNDTLGYEVKREFLQSTVDYYSAEVFKGEFSKSTVDEINSWCSKNTDGMIENFLKKLSPDTAALIISAVCFNSAWASEYSDYQVTDGVFTSQDGEERSVTMLNSNEYVFLENSLATGLMKNYEGGRYAFAALLPNEGIDISKLVEALDADTLRELFASANDEDFFSASIPEFAYDFRLDMTDMLSDMGLDSALSSSADYSGITSDIPLYVDGIEQLTRIELSREGTKAASVAGERLCGSAMPEKSVILDRPFVYMIVDKELTLPVLLGVVTDIAN